MAVLGTALGERHIHLLKRFADTVVLVLDGDEAGQRRTNEILNLFVAAQADLQILTLPDGLDPCDFLVKQGAAAFRQQLASTVDALEYKFRTVTAGLHAASGTHQVQQATEEILLVLALAPRLQSSTTTALRIREDQILHRLSRRFGVPEETLRARLAELRRTSRRSAPAAPSPRKAELPLPPLERSLLELLLQTPEQIEAAQAQIPPQELQNARGRIIFIKCCDLASQGLSPTFERLMLELDDEGLKSLLVELDEQGRDKPMGDPAAGLREVLAGFERRREERQWRTQQAALEERRLGEPEQEQILHQIIERKRSRQGGALPTDG